MKRGKRSRNAPLVINVLDVKVNTLVLEVLLVAALLIVLAELLLTLALLLGARDVEVLTLEVLVVEVVDSGLGTFVGFVVDETEATADALLVAGDDQAGDVAVRGEEFAELVVGHFGGDVLDVEVGELAADLIDLGLALTLRDVVADVDDLVVKKHTVHSLDSSAGGITSGEVNETVTLAVAVLIEGNLAREDVTEGSEGVVKGLVVNGLILQIYSGLKLALQLAMLIEKRTNKVLEEDIATASLAQGRVTLGDHNAARLVFDKRVVELVESVLSCIAKVSAKDPKTRWQTRVGATKKMKTDHQGR